MGVTFEVERFEWAADDRLELEGRWFGLRGRRFIRPTLDVEVDGEPRRLLALMEHKPWAALDGEEWLAAFKWEGEHGDVAAELAVGPDMTFELPRPNGGRPNKASPKRVAATAATAVHPARRAPDEATKRKLAEAERARDKALAEAGVLRRALEQRERTVRELREALDAARTERDAASTEPDAEAADLRRQLDAAVAARHAAIEQADAAERKRYEAAGALAAAEREAKAARQSAADARAEREELRAVTRAARSERDAAVIERDAALARLEGTRRERDSAQLARDAERANHPQVAAVAEAVRRRGPLALVRPRADRTHDEMLALRFAALVALSIVCLLVGIWFLAV